MAGRPKRRAERLAAGLIDGVQRRRYLLRVTPRARTRARRPLAAVVGGLLTTAQIAKGLGLTQRYVRLVCSRGELRSVCPGGWRYRVSPADLDVWIEHGAFLRRLRRMVAQGPSR